MESDAKAVEMKNAPKITIANAAIISDLIFSIFLSSNAKGLKIVLNNNHGNKKAKHPVNSTKSLA